LSVAEAPSRVVDILNSYFKPRESVMAEPDQGEASGSGKAEPTRPESDSVESSSSFSQLRQDVETIKQQVRKTAEALSSSAPHQGSGQSGFDTFFRRLNDICSSGIFFIFLGLGLLFFAWLGLTVGIHTSFSFVLVVLGIAVLLFGTGTQGMGRLTSAEAASRYTISIAGGAGILAIAIGYGMIVLGPRIQEVFELQTHYAWVELRADPRCSLGINKYWAEFTADGQSLAYKSEKGQLFVLLPYYYSELQRAKVIGGAEDKKTVDADFKKTIDAEFTVKNQQDLKDNLLCAPNPAGPIEVPVSELGLQDDSGFDFKRTPIHIFNLVNTESPASKILATQPVLPASAHPDAKPPDVQNAPLPLSVSQ
jgi:hypothetical protein